jgi:hypothetical protein
MGCAIKWSQQPACTALGLLSVQSCQCQPIPAMGGVTTRRSGASSLMSLLAKLVFFHLRGEIFSGFRPFEVCTTKIHCPFHNESFLGPSPSLRDSKRKGCFLKHLSFHSGLIFGIFESTLEVFRRGVLRDCQLLEGFFWLYSMLSYYLSCGLLSVFWIPGYPGPPAPGPRHRPIFNPGENQRSKSQRRPTRGGAS